MEVGKEFRFGGVKMAKSNKIEKTEELIAEYQEAECLWSKCLIVNFSECLIVNFRKYGSRKRV